MGCILLITLGARYGALHTHRVCLAANLPQVDRLLLAGRAARYDMFSFRRTIGPIIGARCFGMGAAVARAHKGRRDTGYQICFAACLVRVQKVRIDTVRRGLNLWYYIIKAIAHDANTHTHTPIQSLTHPPIRYTHGLTQVIQNLATAKERMRYDTEQRESIVGNVAKRARYAILHAAPQDLPGDFKIVQVMI